MLTHLIDGVSSAGGESVPLVSPTTGLVIEAVPIGDSSLCAAAVASAAAAAPVWAALGAAGRAEVLMAAVERVGPHAEELARLQSTEMGQPIAVARPLVDAVVGALAGAAHYAVGYPWRTTVASEGGTSTQVVRLPYGVSALISPWNFPLPVAAGGLAALLCGGNTVVWKPSEQSPLSALRFAELLALPAGVLSVVLGNAATGRALVADERVRFVAFTGSVEAGREVAAASGERLRHTMLELGGKDPVIVDAGVDVERAAAVVSHGAFWNTGQVCASMERIYVHADIAPAFIDALVVAAGSKIVGDPLDEATELGPLVNGAQLAAVEAQVAAAVAGGAKVLTGGVRVDRPGFFYPPTVLVDVDDAMAVMTEETFGPLAPVRVVASFEEGLALASTGRYGLGSTIITNDAAHAARGAEIPAAVCWVNEWQSGAAGAVHEPAGISGLGVVGTLDSVTRPMSLHIALPFDPADPNVDASAQRIG